MASLIANHLKPFMPDIIHLDQTGFIMGREARDNVLKTISLIQGAQHLNFPACLIAINAEKAFDRVGWYFLEGSLQKIGLTAKLFNKIMALYNKVAARVRVNGCLSDPFTFSNGTRQGCPLSPLLYALIMEHLAVPIRNNLDIHGLTVRDHQ